MSPNFLTILANCLYLDFFKVSPHHWVRGKEWANWRCRCNVPWAALSVFSGAVLSCYLSWNQFAHGSVLWFPWENLCVHMDFLGSRCLPGYLAALPSAHHYFRKKDAWQQSSYKINLCFENIITHPQICFSPEAVKRTVKELRIALEGKRISSAHG